MPRFIAIPKTGHIATEVATGTAIKTVLQVATPSTTVIKVMAWGISFDGVVVSDPAGICTLIDTNVAATVTAQTPEIWGNIGTNASLCVGGAALTGYNASAEGTITASKILDPQEVHPQTGYSIWFPKPPVILQSRFLRIRTTFGITVNCLPWIIWEEQP